MSTVIKQARGLRGSRGGMERNKEKEKIKTCVYVYV